MAGYYLIAWAYLILFIHSTDDGHEGCLHLVAIGKATMSTQVQAFQIHIHAVIPLGWRSG